MHDKFKSCKDCPDRCADPNCHDTCEGYQKRAADWRAQKDVKMRNIEIWEYKHERITKNMHSKNGNGKLKRRHK